MQPNAPLTSRLTEQVEIPLVGEELELEVPVVGQLFLLLRGKAAIVELARDLSNLAVKDLLLELRLSLVMVSQVVDLQTPLLVVRYPVPSVDLLHAAKDSFVECQLLDDALDSVLLVLNGSLVYGPPHVEAVGISGEEDSDLVHRQVGVVRLWNLVHVSIDLVEPEIHGHGQLGLVELALIISSAPLTVHARPAIYSDVGRQEGGVLVVLPDHPHQSMHPQLVFQPRGRVQREGPIFSL